jgi:hypothetical protein
VFYVSPSIVMSDISQILLTVFDLPIMDHSLKLKQIVLLFSSRKCGFYDLKKQCILQFFDRWFWPCATSTIIFRISSKVVSIDDGGNKERSPHFLKCYFCEGGPQNEFWKFKWSQKLHSHFNFKVPKIFHPSCILISYSCVNIGFCKLFLVSWQLSDFIVDNSHFV